MEVGQDMVCVARAWSSSFSPSSSPIHPSVNDSWRLFQKTIEGFDCFGNRRLWLWLLGPHSPRSGTAPAVQTASTKTGHFWVGCSRCWPHQAHLRKQCYHSCDTALAKSAYLGKSALHDMTMDCLGKMIFDGFKFARTCYRPKPLSSLGSILRAFIGLWVKVGRRDKYACSYEIPCKSSDLNQQPVREKGVC